MNAKQDSRATPRRIRRREPGWESEASDVFELQVPPGPIPNHAFPDIASALLAAAEGTLVSEKSPELPTLAEPHRRRHHHE